MKIQAYSIRRFLRSAKGCGGRVRLAGEPARFCSTMLSHLTGYAGYGRYCAKLDQEYGDPDPPDANEGGKVSPKDTKTVWAEGRCHEPEHIGPMDKHYHRCEAAEDGRVTLGAAR